MSATLLYWKEEEVFQDSADVIAKTLGLVLLDTK